ncbi:Hypothetical predicted protein [Pelobates cultripes]|uniref:TMEM248/TMEM219 domain-containing protein n=1 Tax=Pelobates cultripes TaxID=61616 RepID=A0AAD1SRB5_PELCU|nr:Hypothetical predicted protein [Pelobates cultripes]
MVFRVTNHTLPPTGSGHGSMCPHRTQPHSVMCQDPPVFVFFVCLVTLSLTFLVFGVFIDSYDVRDSDLTQDWHTFFVALSLLDVCLFGKEAGRANSTGMAGSTLAVSKGPPETIGNVSTLALLRLPSQYMGANHSSLQISVTGQQLGIKGFHGDASLIVTVFALETSTACNDSKTNCPVKTCVTVIGPQSLLPKSKSPMLCPRVDPNPMLVLYLSARKPDITAECYRVGYIRNPQLEAWISKADRNINSIRLICLALTLLVVAILLFCMTCSTSSQPVQENKHLGAL